MPFRDLLNNNQKKKLDAWEKKQNKIIDKLARTNWPVYGRGSKPSFIYSEYSSGIGPCHEVKNNYTGEVLDLTDPSDW